MPAREPLTELCLAGVELRVEGGRLRYRAPAGALDEAGRAAVAERRDEILARVPEGGRVFPLSSPQQRLWFLHRLLPADPTYNVPQVLRLRGRLDAAALERSLGEVVRRHDALRAVFPAVAGEPVQAVPLPGAFALPLIDLAGLSPQSRERRALDLALLEVLRPFDLAREPSLRARLLRLAGDDHLLVATIHHIAFDAWSVGLFLAELSALYGAFAAGRPSPLPELPASYGDYALRQRRRAAGEELRPELDRRRRRLAGSRATLDLPFDRPASAASTSRGSQLFLRLGRELVAGLEGLARRQAATPFTALLACFQALLGRSSGQEDFNVGSPVTGRGRPELARLIGFFANNLVLRADLSGNPSFLDLLGRVREAVLGALADQELPFERLVEELQPERDLARPPLFQVLFHLLDASQWSADLPGLRVDAVALHTGTAKLDLAVTAFAAGGELEVRFEYAADRFEATTVGRLAGHLRELVAGAVADPAQRLDELPVLSAAERHQAIVEWNDGGEPAAAADDAGLDGLFAAQAARTPDAVAVVCGGEALTYAGLARRTGLLAARLRALGVGPEVPVALCLERSLDQVVAILGVLAAGGAYVPLDPALPAERLSWLLADAAAPVLVTCSDLLERTSPPSPSLPPAGRGGNSGTVAVVCLDRPEVWEPAPPITPLPRPAVGPDRAAYVIYTSGSTGRPKGVVVTHANVRRLLTAVADRFGFGPTDVWTLFHSYAFDFSVWELWGALLHGGRLVVVPHLASRSPEAFLELLAAERVTVLNQTPSAFRQLVRAVELGPPARGELALSWVIFGGEALDLRSLDPWLDRFGDASPKLVNMYGITETTVHVTWRRIGRRDLSRSASPIGRPIADLEVLLLDRWLRPVPIGVAGEVCVGGAGLARGYLGRPDLTAERFVPHPGPAAPGERLYCSGDLARRRPAGDLEYLGRLDQQVKVRGFRVEPAEVEAALGAHPAVAASAVAARPDAAGEPRLVAWVVPAGEPPADTELRAFLRQRLPDHMVPSAFVTLAALPLTANGKLDRAALPAPGARAEVTGSQEPPRTPLEERLAGIWAELLEVERVGVDDDFFALGGHSLLAVRLLHRVREALGAEVPLARLLADPTVAGLAAALGEAGAAAPVAGEAAGAAGGGRFPLSFAQRRLWFLDQLQGGSPVYNVARAVRATGRLSPAALRAALAEVVGRHQPLRSRFAAGEEDGEPVQVVLPPSAPELPLVDLAGLSAAAREAEARRLTTREAARPFDLGRGPLLRAALLRLGAGDHLLLLSLHHAAADAWSMGLLFGELGEAYAAFVAGRPSPLPPLPARYSDFTRRQRERLAGGALPDEIAWWRERLAGAPALLELPADRPRPAVQSFRGAMAVFELPAVLAAELRALGQAARATPFMTLLAAFQALLARLTGADDLVVGSPAADRDRREWAGLIGFFLNTLALRGDLAGDPMFGELVARVRSTALAAYAHAALPFELLVEELKPERGLSHAPLFQVMFILDGPPPGTLRLPGLELRPEAVHSGTAKFDLTLIVEDGGERLTGQCEYSTDLFDAATVARLLGHWRTLLGGAAADPERRLSELPLLTAGERWQLLTEWGSGAAAPVAGDVVSWFEAHAAGRPAAVAVAGEGERLTYGQLDRRANRLAWRLRALGVGPESRVAIRLGRGPEMAVAVLAVLKAGGAYLPLDPGYPLARIALMLADARATVLLTAAGLLAGLDAAGVETVLLDAGMAAEEAAAGPPREVHPGNLAYVIYTSGSTGRPKGVAMPHGALANMIAWQLRTQAPGPPPVTLQFASLSFDVSFQEMFTTWCAGGTLVLTPEELRRDPRALLLRLAAERVERLFLPVAALESLAEGAEEELLAAGLRVREVITAGEQLRISRQIAAFCERLPGCELHNHYGPSETHVVTALALAGPPRAWPALPAIGRPIDNARAVVLDAAMGPVPAGIAGELYLGGSSLARGYLDRPDATAERFLPDPFAAEPGARLYRTGDRARVRADGLLEFLGRADHQVKLRGYRIEPGEVEAALAAHPAVRAAAVALHGNGSAGAASRRLVAWVVPDGEADREGLVPDLYAHLKARLPDYMVPALFELLSALPLTPSGKVDRRALPAPGPAAPVAGPALPPRTPTERALAEVWCEVLGLPAVGVEDDFFALGGHSLLAARVMTRVRRSLGVDLPLAELFAGPTVAALAAAVARAREQGAEPRRPLLKAVPRRERRLAPNPEEVPG